MLKALASLKRLCIAEEESIGFTHDFTYTSKHHKFREKFYSLGIRKQKQGESEHTHHQHMIQYRRASRTTTLPTTLPSIMQLQRRKKIENGDPSRTFNVMS